MEAFNIFDVWGKVFYGGDILEHPFKELLFFMVRERKVDFFMQASKKFYSIPEAATLCGVSRTTLWNWVKSGHVKALVTPGGIIV